MSVTEEQLAFYEKEGYVVIRGALTDGDLAPLIQEHDLIVDEIARDLHTQGKIASLHENEPFKTRLARIADECEQVDSVPDIGNTRRRATFDFLRNQRLETWMAGLAAFWRVTVMASSRRYTRVTQVS